MQNLFAVRKGRLVFALLASCASAFAFSAILRAASPVPAYAVAEVNVTNSAMYRKYIAAVSPVVAHFGGKYIIRAGSIVPVEGKAPTGRFIVIEFPSLAVAQKFESSPEYRAIAPLRQRAATSRIFLIEGAPQ
jgi:uncharacterized protein (DUF1330 family)